MFCDSAQKLNKLRDVCKVLQRLVGPHIIHSLIDMLNSDQEHTKEIILLINNLLEGELKLCFCIGLILPKGNKFNNLLSLTLLF